MRPKTSFQAIESGFYSLVIIGVLTTVVGAYYYLKIVKVMYFEDLSEEIIDKITEIQDMDLLIIDDEDYEDD